MVKSLEEAQKVALALCVVVGLVLGLIVEDSEVGEPVEQGLGLEVEEREAREPVVDALSVADAQLKTEAVIGEALVEWDERNEGVVR